MLNEEQRKELLRAARWTLEQYLERGVKPGQEGSGGQLLEERGAFVTLHAGDRLRGCIGTFTSQEPLLDTVQSMAIAAATSDPRFPAVTAAELPGLTVEISALSPLRQATAEEVTVGVHGIYITRGHRRGVLLPQVATEHGWDRETFLDHTCIKAGLPPGTWRDPGTRIEVFEAEVFSEDDLLP